MIYPYRCKDCKKKFEIEVVGMLRVEKKRPITPACPKCGSKDVKKLIVIPNIKLNAGSKGGGI